MIAFLSKHRKPIFIGTVATFLIAIFVGLGAYAFIPDSEAVGEVRGEKLPYKMFSMKVNKITESLRNSGADMTDVLKKGIYQQVFSDMVVNEYLHQEAIKAGMKITDFEVAMQIQSNPAFIDGGRFNPRAYVQAINSEFAMNPKEYEDWLKYELLVSKYKEFLISGIKITDTEMAMIASAVNPKEFEKNRREYMNQYIKMKYSNMVNYMLTQFTKNNEVKNFIEKRMEGL